MPRDAYPIGHRAAPWVVVAALSLVAMLVFRPPWAPQPYEDTLDDAWRLALSSFVVEGRAFGRDVIFTFGPLGFLYDVGPMPATYPIALAVWLGLAGVMWAVVRHLARRGFVRWPLALLWSFTVIGAVTWTDDAFFLSVAAAVLILQFDDLVEAGSLRAVPLLAALAVGALVKSSLLVSALVVLGAVTADGLRRQRPPRAAVVFVALFVGAWMAAGQRVGDVPAFLSSAFEVVSGYSIAMSVVGSAEPVAIAAVVATILVLGVLARGGPGRLLHAAAFGALLLLSFKAGFVRHANQPGVGFASVGPIGLLLLPSLFCARGRPARALAVLSVVSLLGLWLADARTALPVRLVVARARARAAANLEGIRTLTRRGAAGVRASYADQLRVIAARHPVPPDAASIEVYPWGVHIPIAHGLRVASRPVFQSYQAYSPSLAERNAAWLRGPEAPPVVLFDVWGLDGRFPALDDGLSWPELLTRYDVVDTSPGALVLRHVAATRRYAFSPPIESTIHIGESVPVPSQPGQLLWARLDVQPTLAGRLVSMVYKLPPIALEVAEKGAWQRFRLVASARAGFLLSPVVDDRVAFALLGSTLDPRHPGAAYLDEHQVLRLRVAAGDSARWYRPDVRLSLQTLSLPPGATSLPPGVERRLGLLVLARGAQRTRQSVFFAPADDGETLLVTPTSSRTPIARHGFGSRLRLGFGLRDDPGGDAVPRCATVEFRVAAAAGNVLWSRRLTRDATRTTTLPESADVELGSAEDIVVEVVPPSADCASMAYWSEATLVP